MARNAKKQKLINSAWTRNGACYISKIVKGETQIAEVKDEANLLSLLPKFKMPEQKPKGRKEKTPANKKTANWTEEDHQSNQPRNQRRAKQDQEEEEEGQISESTESDSDSDDSDLDESGARARSNSFLASKNTRVSRRRAASPNSQDHSATPGPSGASETLVKKNATTNKAKGIKKAGQRRPSKQ